MAAGKEKEVVLGRNVAEYPGSCTLSFLSPESLFS